MFYYCPIHADGDCLGSAFGLAYFLCGKGISVEIISEEKPPENLSFVYRSGKMPANMLFSVWDPQNAEKISKYDLAIAVDTSDEKPRQQKRFVLPGRDANTDRPPYLGRLFCAGYGMQYQLGSYSGRNLGIDSNI